MKKVINKTTIIFTEPLGHKTITILLIISIIFLIKTFTVLYLVDLTKCINSEFIGIASMSGDANSYITPIDNFISEGHYYYETAEAGRMPYLGLVYYPFRLIFSKKIALSIVVLLQILMESIAIYYIAKLCYKLFNIQQAFLLYLLLAIFSLHVTIFDFSLLSESLGISFLCLFVYHYYSFLEGCRTKRQLIIVGFFLTLAVLFKPMLSTIFLFIGVEFLWYNRHCKFLTSIKYVIIYTLIVSAPLIIINTPWTIRNYTIFNKFLPFQQDPYAGYNYSSATLAVWKFIETIGESFVFYDKRSAGCYFEPKKGMECEYQFPDRIFSANLTMNKIEEARMIYLDYQKHTSDSLNNLTVQKFNTLTDIYKKERTFSYYIIRPIMLSNHFLFHSGSYFLPIKKDSACYQSYQWMLKLSQSILYYLCLIFGFLGTILIFRKNPLSFIIPIIPIYLIILYPMVFSFTEFRYFMPAYPFLLIGLTFMLLKINRFCLK